MDGFSHLTGVTNQYQVTKSNRCIIIEVFDPQPNPVLQTDSFTRLLFILSKSLSFGIIVTCFIDHIPGALADFRWDKNSVNRNQIELVRFSISVSFENLD
jgi:hypothetical protein